MMAIRFYDSLTKRVEPFTPGAPGRVSMYVCGPTVYNYIHIGNGRTFVWFDFIHRYLEYRGYDVTYVMNYTDVDDRIIERANIEKLPHDAITKKYEVAFERDMASLGAETPDIVCRATDHIEGMVEAIQGLVDKGIAYEAAGNVWYPVESFEGYGKLSGRSLEDMRAGERVEPHESKRHPLDFSLWKSAKEGEPAWDSPWGPGRPGWHIECSVMSTRYLGMGFDIHAGGIDLIFPHHENEIAQAEGLSGQTPFVRHWLHSAHVLMEEVKMSKSLGNVVLARDAAEYFGAEAVRYWALASSYNSQSVFSQAALEDAAQAYDRWSTLVAAARHVLGSEMPPRPEHPERPDDDPSREPPTGYAERFIEELDDDFNSAGAFAVVHGLVGEANKHLDGAQRGDAVSKDNLKELVASFLELTSVLGFRFEVQEGSLELTGSLIGYLLELREKARSERAFERADEIRQRLLDMGVAIEDTPAGARWRIGGSDR